MDRWRERAGRDGRSGIGQKLNMKRKASEGLGKGTLRKQFCV